MVGGGSSTNCSVAVGSRAKTAMTLLEVFTEHSSAQLHGATAGLTEVELDQLVAYLPSVE